MSTRSVNDIGRKALEICQFNDAYIPVMDGVSITVQNYAYWISRKFAPCGVATPSFPHHVDTDPFPVYRYFSVPFFSRKPYRLGLPSLDRSFRKTMKAKDLQLVHTHSPFTAGKFALKIARERRIPIVATLHTKYREDIQRVLDIDMLVDQAIRSIVDFYHSVDFVWVPQPGVGATLREYGYTGPYEVIENGIDLEVPREIEPWRKLGAKRLGLPDSCFVGLYVGQHVLEKNLDFLLDCVGEICGIFPEFRMIFVGEGYARAHLMKKAERGGFASKCIFHDVVRDRDILKELYARSDLFLFPSLYDNAPLVVREAAAFRTPSIMLEGATAAEPIVDGQNGYLAFTRNPSDFARRVLDIARDAGGREAAGIQASHTLCRSWESVLDQVISKYSEILSDWK